MNTHEITLALDPYDLKTLKESTRMMADGIDNIRCELKAGEQSIP